MRGGNPGRAVLLTGENIVAIGMRYAQRFQRRPRFADDATHNIGAQERTRTSTPLRELAPEASASANSATWAFLAANNEAQPYCRVTYGLSTKHTQFAVTLTLEPRRA
jgi:hypothetical protein